MGWTSERGTPTPLPTPKKKNFVDRSKNVRGQFLGTQEQRFKWL